MIDTSKVDINKAQVWDQLQRHVGEDSGIHMRDLVARILDSVLTSQAAERKVRELIAELRLEGKPICGHPASGYFMAANDKELHQACKFLLDRAAGTVELVAAMKNREAPDLYEALGVRKTPAPETHSQLSEVPHA